MALEANMTVWNVDTNTENSGPSLERMVRTSCFSSFDLSTPQDLSCDSKSEFCKEILDIIEDFWIQCENIHLQHMSPHIIMFPKSPSKVVQASLGVLHEDM